MKYSIHSALVLAAVFFWGGWNWLQRPDKDVERGNAAFATNDYRAALDAYAAALESNGDTPRIHYDMGAALYKLAENTQGPAARVDLYARAERAFRQATSSSDVTLRSLAHYNLGNTLARLGYYEKAVHAYKQALHANPLNDDARHNLELVQRLLRPDHEQMPPQGRRPGSSGQDASGQDSPGPDPSGQDSPGQDPSGQDPSGQDGQDGQPGDASEDPGPGSDASGSGEPEAQKDSPGQSGQNQGSSSTGQSRSGQAGKSPAQPDQGSGSANTGDADAAARKTPDNPPGSSGNNSGRPAGASKDRPREHESTGDVNKKLDALERMSRELRRNKLRNSATQSRRHASGKDW